METDIKSLVKEETQEDSHSNVPSDKELARQRDRHVKLDYGAGDLPCQEQTEKNHLGEIKKSILERRLKNSGKLQGALIKAFHRVLPEETSTLRLLGYVERKLDGYVQIYNSELKLMVERQQDLRAKKTD